MRHIDYLVISPSKDINQIAMSCYDDIPLSIRTLFRGIGINKDNNSDLWKIGILSSLAIIISGLYSFIAELIIIISWLPYEIHLNAVLLQAHQDLENVWVS